LRFSDAETLQNDGKAALSEFRVKDTEWVSALHIPLGCSDGSVRDCEHVVRRE